MRRGIITSLALLLCASVAQAQITLSGNGRPDWEPTSPIIWDEFLTGGSSAGTIGALGWNVAGTMASSTTYTVFADRPGVYSLTNAAAATGGIGSSSGFTFRYASVDTVIFWVASGTGVNNPSIRVGMQSYNPNTAPNDDSCVFEHLAADTNWFAVTRDGAASETRRDTGIVFAYDTFYKLMIKHPSTGVWDFYINGVLTNHVTADTLPTETFGSFFGFQVLTNGTAVAAYIDYFWAKMKTSR